MVCQGLWKDLSKKESLELVLHPDRVGRFHRLTGSGLQTDGATKLSERAFTKRFQIRFWNFRKRIGGYVKFDMCRTKLEGKRGVYCRSDGTQKLLSCTRSGILQAASAVHLTVVLCDLAYLSSDQAVLRCSEPSVSVPQADRPRLSCGNQAMSEQLLVRLTK